VGENIQGWGMWTAIRADCSMLMVFPSNLSVIYPHQAGHGPLSDGTWTVVRRDVDRCQTGRGPLSDGTWTAVRRDVDRCQTGHGLFVRRDVDRCQTGRGPLSDGTWTVVQTV